MKSGQRAKVNFKMVGQAAKICQPKEAAKNPKWLPFWADSQSSCPLKNVTNEILSFSHNHLHSTLVSFVWVFRVFFFWVFRVFWVSAFVFTCRLQAADLDRSGDSGSDPGAWLGPKFGARSLLTSKLAPSLSHFTPEICSPASCICISVFVSVHEKKNVENQYLF